MARRIDVNADVGEGVGDDAALLAVVTSANVACGFHAGDPPTMRAVCAEAVARGVVIGAQPSYRDRAGFGRRPVEVGHDALLADLVEQVDALADAAARAGGSVRYVKPHGALYNRAVHDDEHAGAVVAVCAQFGLPVLALPGSRLLALAAEAGVPAGREFFADRGYDGDGRLVARGRPGAVIDDVEQVRARVRALVARGAVADVSGRPVNVAADSICVHGDTPGAVGLARAVREVLEAGGVAVEGLW